MLEFARSLPHIRVEDRRAYGAAWPATREGDRNRRPLTRNDAHPCRQRYAKQNKSYGLTTMRGPHVKVEGAELRFHFTGISGTIIWDLRASIGVKEAIFADPRCCSRTQGLSRAHGGRGAMLDRRL